ncbi:unnamed protein product [Schistosoma turkestanicum]|nr:unnamed protein product [Schistosoma turkestanicum]
MNDIAKFSNDLNYLDFLASVRADKIHSGSKNIRTGPYLIRYSTFLNHLQRIAVHCGLQLSSGPCSGGGTSAGALVWRLTSECFAVIVAATNNSITTSDSTYNNSPELTDLISIAAVYFEFNHDKAVPCPELATDLSMGKYSSLLQHVDNLLTIYAVPGDKIDRARTYLCLQALEKDLSMLTQAMRTDLENNIDAISTFRRAPNQKHDVFSMRDLVNRSLVGHFVGRTGGRLARLTYLVTSAQAMIGNATGVIKNNLQVNSKSTYSTSIGCGSRDGLIGGYMARIGLCPRLSYVDDSSAVAQSTVQRLPFMPLVTLQKDAYGISVPHFAQPDEIKCISIEAEFVLHLDPPLPISTDAIQQLERTTGLSNTEITDQKEEDIVLLILRKHKQEHLYGINTHLQNPNITQHSYQIKSDVKAYLVSSVPFTCSDQIGEIISILRKQASALAFYETFIVHPDKPVEKDAALTFTFNIKIMAGQMISLEFDDPNRHGAKIHASLHVRPFDVQCLELNSSNTHDRLNSNCPSNDHEVNAMSLNKPDIESEGDLKANFSKILTKTHTLPIGFVWLLTQLQCPVHKQLVSMKLPITSAYKSTENKESYSSVNQNQLSSLRAMLNRVKSSIIIRGANGTGGVLCGGDRKTSLDFESSSSFAAAQVFALNTPNYLNVAKKIPPLPPGVMATPPPAFTHLDANSGDLGIMSSLRPVSCQGKLRDVHSNPNLSVASTNSSRGLRLDDLLVDSTFQTQQHNQQRNPPISFSHPLPSYISPSPGTHTTSLADVKDAYSDMINPNVSTSNHLSLPTIHSSHKHGSSVLSGSNCIPPNLYNMPPMCISASSSEITSSSTITKSKSFTASPVSDSSRAPSTSGSMLVNLLNEDSLSTSIPLMSPCSTADRHQYSSSHSLTSFQNSPHPSAASNVNISSSRLPGIILSNNSQPSSSNPQLSQECGKSLCSSAPNLTANNSQYPSVRNSSLITPTGRTKHATLKNSQGSLAVNPALNPKKPRKRRRGTVEGSFQCISSQKGNTPVPCVYSNYPATKHQRVDTVLPTTNVSLSGTYQRPTFNQTNSNFSSSSLPHVQQSTVASTVQSNSMQIPNPSKSVYDFDDNPGSVFDVPVGNISSSNSLSFSSGSSLTSPKSSVSVNPLQSGGLAVSNTNPISNYPVTTMMSSNSNLERTIERKTSLKMTIKTIPSQPITSTPKARVNFSQNEVDKYNRIQSVQSNPTSSSTPDSGGTVPHTQSLPSVKKRKKRSVEGKPSAYMLQMLQLANSSISSSDTPITTTSVATGVSGVPSQSAITPLVLSNSGLKQIKSTNKLVGHGSVLVKKERKRRLGHGFTEKTHFSFIPNSNNYNHLQETTDNSNIPKLIKINRVSRPSTSDVVPKDNQTGSGPTPNLYNNYMSMSPNSASSKKKISAVSSTPLVTGVGIGPGSDDMIVAKRLVPSSASPLLNSDKRKRNSDTSKQSSNSQSTYSNSGTSGDSAFISSPLLPSTSSDPLTNSTTTRKTPRPSLHTASNLSRVPHNPTSRSQPAQQSNTLNYLSSSSVCATNPASVNVVGSSSGLIKGYKIPKKKSSTTGCLPNLPLSDTSGDKSLGMLSTASQQIQESISSYRDTSGSQSPEKSDESSLTIVENLYPSSNDPNFECVDTINVAVYNENINDPGTNNDDNPSIPSDPVSGFVAGSTENCPQSVLHPLSLQSNPNVLGQCPQPSQQNQQQQQFPRKSSVKSISDIVDKLRAKSTTSISSSTPTVVSGSSDIGCSDLTAITSCEVQDSTINSVQSDHTTCVRSNTRKVDESQDQWRDNIFEKFCPSGTPTPHQAENGQNNICKSDSEVDLSTSTENNNDESVWVGSDKEPVYDKDERNTSSNSDTPMIHSNTQPISDSDGKQGKEPFEFIKANTDTPASPTEFLTTVPTSSSNVSSKIIPISPTSMKCLNSTGSVSGTNIKPNIVRHGSLRFEKKTGSGRFSRLGGGINGMMLHGGPVQRSNSDSYSHSGGGHGHSNRLPRGGMNNSRHNKAPNFKPPSNWGPINMDYGNMGVAPSSSSSAAGPPSIEMNNSGNMGHWMMPSGGNINQNNSNMMPYNNPHSMQHHPYHSALNNRPMRPSYNVNGTTGHNPYNAGMMRECLKSIKADIVILLDGTKVIDQFSFEFYVKDYLSDLAKKLSIKSDGVLISVILFTDQIHFAVKPEHSVNLPSLLMAINSMKQPDDNMMKGDIIHAISHILNFGFISTNNMDTQNITRMCILLTNGNIPEKKQRQDNQIFIESQNVIEELHNRVDYVFSIGIPGANQPGVRRLAKPSQYAFPLTEFNGYKELDLKYFDPTEVICPMKIPEYCREIKRLLFKRPIEKVNGQTVAIYPWYQYAYQQRNPDMRQPRNQYPYNEYEYYYDYGEYNDRRQSRIRLANPQIYKSKTNDDILNVKLQELLFLLRHYDNRKTKTGLTKSTPTITTTTTTTEATTAYHKSFQHKPENKKYNRRKPTISRISPSYSKSDPSHQTIHNKPSTKMLNQSNFNNETQSNCEIKLNRMVNLLSKLIEQTLQRNNSKITTTDNSSENKSSSKLLQPISVSYSLNSSKYDYSEASSFKKEELLTPTIINQPLLITDNNNDETNQQHEDKLYHPTYKAYFQATDWQDSAMHNGAILMFAMKSHSGLSINKIYSTGRNITSILNKNTAFNETQTDHTTDQADMSSKMSTSWYKHDLFDQWYSGSYKYVLYELWSNHNPVVQLKFNARYADKYTWFNKLFLKASYPWNEYELLEKAKFILTSHEAFSVVFDPNSVILLSSVGRSTIAQLKNERIDCEFLRGYILIVDNPNSAISQCKWNNATNSKYNNFKNSVYYEYPKFFYTLPINSQKVDNLNYQLPPKFSNYLYTLYEADELRIYVIPYGLMPSKTDGILLPQTNKLLIVLDTHVNISFSKLWYQEIASPPSSFPLKSNNLCNCWYRNQLLNIWYKPKTHYHTQNINHFLTSNLFFGFHSIKIELLDQIGHIKCCLIFNTYGAQANSWFSPTRLTYSWPWSIKTLTNYNFVQFGDQILTSGKKHHLSLKSWSNFNFWIGKQTLSIESSFNTKQTNYTIKCLSIFLVHSKNNEYDHFELPECMKGQINLFKNSTKLTILTYNEDLTELDNMKKAQQITIWSN